MKKELINGHYRCVFTEEDISNIIKWYVEEGKSMRQIASIFGLARSKPIARILDEHDIDHSRGSLASFQYYYEDGIYNEQDEIDLIEKIKSIPDTEGKAKYSINEHYFDDLRNPEALYTLGFLYADGCNCKGDIRMCLEEQDGYILERINKNMENERPVIFLDKSNKHDFGYTYENQYQFTTSNKRINQVLTLLGVVPRKSLILTFPTWLHPSMYSHFLLGVFDGDGSVYRFIRKTSTPQVNLTITSTESFCRAIVDICAKYIGIKGHIYDASCHNGITRVFTLSGPLVAKKFLDWMYKDATIFLQRKYDKYCVYYDINKPIIA